MRKKILVVDDDADWVELISFNLKKAGFLIGTATNGIDALKKARTLIPDLILLDLKLPELDGFAVNVPNIAQTFNVGESPGRIVQGRRAIEPHIEMHRRDEGIGIIEDRLMVESGEDTVV